MHAQSQVPPDDSSIQALSNILRAIDGLQFLPEFISDHQDDYCIEALSKLPTEKYAKKYRMQKDLAALFVEQCRLFVAASATPVSHACASGSTLPPPSDENERQLWLKACLVLEACIKGMIPFVSQVMKALHDKIIRDVKDSVERDFGVVEDRDWNCSLCPEAVDSKDFVDNGPVALRVKSFDSNGVAEADAPHCLKAGSLQPCRWKNAPPAFLYDAHSMSPIEPLFLVPHPSQADNPKSSSFLLLRDNFTLSESGPTPFRVELCLPSGLLSEFYAVLCTSSPRHTSTIVNSFYSKLPAPKCHGVSELLFWTLELKNSMFADLNHNLKQGSMVKFSGSHLPPIITEGSLYVVTKSSTFSFCVKGPVIRPSSAVELVSSDSHLVVRQCPPARFRDAALMYHSKSKAEPHWSSIRARRLSSHHGEFCKFFCSQTGRELDFFSEIDTRGGEQMLNMIDMCTVFNPDAAVFRTLFVVRPESVLKLTSALQNLKRGVLGTHSKDSKDFGVRDIRNKLFHEFLTLESKDFESLEKSSRLVLTSVRDIISSINGSHCLDYVEHALSTIDGLIARDIRVSSLSSTEQAVLTQQKQHMLKELDEVKEQAKLAELSLFNFQAKQRRLQQNLLFCNFPDANLEANWTLPVLMRIRAGDAQPDI
jgi:hypothetical protein